MPTKLEPGCTIPFDSLETIRNEQVNLKGGNGIIHIHFARFTGCPVYFKRYSMDIKELQDANIESYFVLHSPAKLIMENQYETQWAKHLEFVSDQPRKLYKLIGSEPSKNFFRFYSLKSIFWMLCKPAEVKKFKNKGAEDGTDQIPADVLLNAKDGKILAIKYGKTIADRWSALQVLEIARKNQAS